MSKHQGRYYLKNHSLFVEFFVILGTMPRYEEAQSNNGRGRLKRKGRQMKPLKSNCFLVLSALFLLIGARTACAGQSETDYLAILLQGKKVGHAIHTRTVEDHRVITTDSVSMTLGRGGQAVTITSQESHIETPDGKPLGFEMTLTTSGVEQKTVGTVSEGKAKISRQIMGQTQELTIDWPEGALLNEGLRLFQIEQGLVPGTSFDVNLFRPDLLANVEASLQIGDKATVDLLGRAVELTTVRIVMSVQGQKIEMVSYVDEQLTALKTQVPMMGMQLEMIACDKSFAMRDDDIVDFLDKLSIASPVKLINLHTTESAAYTLKPTTDKGLELPASSMQAVKTTEGESGIVVTVTKTQPPSNIPFPYKGNDPKALEALKETDYIQCTNKTIIELAKRAVGDTTDAAIAASQIEAFVDGYITQKDLSVGYASAAEVAQTRQGDCSEHAILAAAMCRAAGIPARIACGIVYADSFLSKQSIFGGHMWVEVYLDGAWYGLDATRSQQQGFGPGHITLAHGNGDPTDFFGLVNTLGCFKIEKITLEKKETAVKEPEEAPTE
jgi:hypothetical protein